MRDECVRRGYDLVYTPHIMKRELWRISGHEVNYGENMYPPMELDDAEYRLKPMNCPGHILIYKNSPKSYRDLPVSGMRSWATCIAMSGRGRCTGCCACVGLRRMMRTSFARLRRLTR